MHLFFDAVVSIPTGSITVTSRFQTFVPRKRFQFQLVRLQSKAASSTSPLQRVSIPTGSITVKV